MSSPSSLPPPPGPPPPPPFPPPSMSGPPPTGAPPPPPPPPTDTSSSSAVSNVTSANYFFGFVITFVVLVLLFVGCGIGSWRRFRLIGTGWDERLQDMDGGPFSARKRGRRRLVRPVFSETWTHPKALTHLESGKGKWEGVQPISTAFVWSRSTLAGGQRRSDPQTSGRGNGGSVRGVAATLQSYVFPRRPRCDHLPKPPPVARPPPEAIQVAVMIAMPSSPSLPRTSGPVTDGPTYVGHAGVGEYEVGVVRIPWPSGEGP